MSKKIGTLVSMALVAVATAGLMRFMDARPAGTPAVSAPPVTPPPAVDRFERKLVRAGAQLALAAQASAAAPPGPDDEGTPAGDLREAEAEKLRAAKEARHYDAFDRLVEAGGGAEHVEQLRRNIEAGKRVTGRESPAALRQADITCGQTVCRVKVRVGDPGQALQAAYVLGIDMGGLSMRPAGGSDAVYYIGAAGHPLPEFHP